MKTIATSNYNMLSVCKTCACIQIVFFHMIRTAPIPIEAVDNLVFFNFLRHFISIISLLAVPVFALISGYLSLGSWNRCDNYKEYISKRFKRLIIPSFLWTTFFLILYLCVQNFPFSKNLFSGDQKLILDYNLLDWINAYTGIFTGYPFAAQYWFILLLFVVDACLPIWMYLIQKTGVWYIISCSLIWIVLVMNDMYGSMQFKLFYFFQIGLYLNYKHKKYGEDDSKCLYYLFAAVIFLALLLFDYENKVYKYVIETLFLIFGALCYPLVLKKLLDKRSAPSDWLEKLSAYAFLIFLAHQQFQMFFKRFIFHFMPNNNELLIIIVYFSIPILVICISFKIIEWLKNVPLLSRTYLK